VNCFHMHHLNGRLSYVYYVKTIKVSSLLEDKYGGYKI
jgi:hypothetical protein